MARERTVADWERRNESKRYAKMRAELKQERDKLESRAYLWKKSSSKEAKKLRAIAANGKFHWWDPKVKNGT